MSDPDLVRHLAPTGSITLLGAISARAGRPGTAGLGAINGAVEATVKPLAVELAPVRVNAVSPGLVDTPWWDGMPEDARRDHLAKAATVLPARHGDRVRRGRAAGDGGLTGRTVATCPMRRCVPAWMRPPSS